MSRSTLKYLFLLLLIVVLFYWKILLTRQFSLLTEHEGVSQAYSWYNFLVTSVQEGVLPLWDPYAFSGRSFIGEMQTGAFYPLNLLLALVPLNRNNLFSPQLYHYYFVFAHILAACFMFALIREFGLSRFSALIAGICFSLGGFTGSVPWPHHLHSSIWLPLIFLFLLRALKAGCTRAGVVNASLAGTGLGLSILAGGLHVTMMQATVVASAVVFHALYSWKNEHKSLQWRKWLLRSGAILGLIAVVSFGTGAIQLLPSIEYGNHAIRFLGIPEVPTVTASEKIPYVALQQGAWPHHFVSFLMPQAFNGVSSSGERSSPYIGAFAFLLAIIGIWKNWAFAWVRYLAGLCAVTYIYMLASYSLLHGLVYALVPFLWLAREAGRFVYLAGFALSILAAFGAETLMARAGQPEVWRPLTRVIKWVVIVLAIGLAIPAVFGTPVMHQWVSFSILMILLAAAVFRYITGGHTGPAARFLMIALILSDLNPLNWTARNKIEAANTGTDHLEALLSCRKAAEFLKAQPGLFRVHVDGEFPPNVGETFMLHSTNGRGATLPIDYSRIQANRDLFNVRYFIRPASASEPGSVYSDEAWKIYENPKAYPRAWLVHETVVETAWQELLERVHAPDFDGRRIALLDAPLKEPGPEPIAGDSTEKVVFENYTAHKLGLRVQSASRALLVLSENYFPGWQARVNGQSARIYKVNGGLRGVMVPPGEAEVTFEYASGSVFAGSALTGITLLGLGILLIVHLRRRLRAMPFDSEIPASVGQVNES